MRTSYKAWVPTVNGRLSFRFIGETNYPTRPEYSNLRIGKHQYIVVRQNRNSSDVLFGLSKFFGIDGSFEYLLAARARVDDRSPDAKLIGRLYLFRAVSLKRIKNQLDRLFAYYRELERNPFNGVRLRYLYGQTHLLLESEADIVANSILHRNGVLAISNIRWRDINLYNRSADYFTESHAEINSGIADQLYFFVRDIAHQHQHHSPDADTIITAQECLGTDTSWCKDVLYSLYYHIIDMKRQAAFSEQIRALGILAYIQSFEQIAKQAGCDLPLFNREAAKESIESSRAYIESKLSQERQQADKTRTIALWLGGLSLAMIGLVVGFAEDTVPADPWVIKAANFLKVQAWTILIPFGVAALYWTSTRVLYRCKPLWRDITRAALVNRVLALVITSAVIGVFLFLLLISLANIYSILLR